MKFIEKAKECTVYNGVLTRPKKILRMAIYMTLGLLAPAFGAPNQPWKSDVSYGEYPNQILDIYLPTGSGPFPVAVFIHGGGWRDGDKVQQLLPNHRDKLLTNGIAVVSVNYRFLPEANKKGIFPPVLLPLNDCRRALQFIRYNTTEWNLDPDRIALFGGSAGAFTALWLALSSDMAIPESSDPIERISTRVRAVGGYSAQTSIDPAQMRTWVGPKLTYGGAAFGVTGFDEFLARRHEFVEWFSKLSPALLIDAGDPPVYLSYNQGLDIAKPDNNYFTHSPQFGIGFEQIARECGATCYLQYPGHASGSGQTDLGDFLIRELTKK